MSKLIVIGGSPSSGSTLLVSQLNQKQGVFCLPETGLLSHGAYLKKFISNEEVEHRLDLYLPWLCAKTKFAQSMGWNIEEVSDAFQFYNNSFELLGDLFNPLGKKILVEKTPENIFSFQNLIENEDVKLIVTTRSALGVTASLVSRGFTILEALLIWFAHCYTGIKLIHQHPSKIFHFRYRAFCSDPLKILDAIFEFIGAEEKLLENESDNFCLVSKKKLASSFISLTKGCWQSSPTDMVITNVDVNWFGSIFDYYYNKLVFQVEDEDFFSVQALDQAITGEGNLIPIACSSEVTQIPLQINSLLVETLLKQFTPVVLNNSTVVEKS